MALIIFYTENPVSKNQLENFLNNEFCRTEFFWFTEYDDDYLKNTENQADNVIQIRHEKIAETGFCHAYEIMSNLKDLDFNEETTILKRLAQYIEMQIMASDDEIAEFLWQVIDIDGKSFTGVIDDDIEESLILIACESTSVASFYTQNPLSIAEENQLKQLFKAFYPQIILEYEKLNLSNDRNLVKIFGEQQLAKLTHSYKIYPVISKTWKSKKAKSEIAISVFKQWQSLYPEIVLLFPADYRKVENVKGGCDSREYCVVLNNGNFDKIEYKQPKDWNYPLNLP